MKLRMDEGTRRVTILGDFFLHPEESIADLEDLLSTAPPSISREELLNEMTALLKKLQARTVGFSAQDLVELYLEVR